METGIPTKSELPSGSRSALSGLRSWYGRWVQVREARYRYLEAILDGEPSPDELAPSRAERTSKQPGEEP